MWGGEAGGGVAGCGFGQSGRKGGREEEEEGGMQVYALNKSPTHPHARTHTQRDTRADAH